MDAIQPVGAMIQPPNPQQGLNAYSTLLGLQHQRVGLEQQQQELSQQTSQATVAGQGAKENQNLARLLSDPVGNGITDKEGNPLPDAQQKILSVAPTTGAANYQKVVEAARAKVGFQSDLTTLSAAQRAQVGSVLSADNSTGASREQSVQNLIQLARDNPSLTGVAMRAVAMLPSQPHSTGNPQQDEQAQAQHQKELTDARNGFGRAVVGPENAASLNMPIVGTQYDKTGNLVGTAQSRTTGEFGQAGGQTGAGMKVGLGPTQTVPYQAAVAGAAAQAGGLGAGTSKIDVDTYNKALTAGAQSSTIMDLAKRVEREAGEARTGKFSQEFANRLTAFQQHNPGATAIQVLQKDAANLKTMAEAGLSTDAERAQVGAGLPSPETMGPDALQKAARYWQGYAKMTGGRRDVALSNQGPAGYAVKDAEYMKGASPGAYEPKQTATSAQLADYARRKGISVEQARAHAEAHGMTISQ